MRRSTWGVREGYWGLRDATIDEVVCRALHNLGLEDFPIQGGPESLLIAADALEERTSDWTLGANLRAISKDCLEYADRLATRLAQRTSIRTEPDSRIACTRHYQHTYCFFDDESEGSMSRFMPQDIAANFVLGVNRNWKHAADRKLHPPLLEGNAGHGPLDVFFCSTPKIVGRDPGNPQRTAGLALRTHERRADFNVSSDFGMTVTKLAWLYAAHPGYDCEHRVVDGSGEGAVFVEVARERGSVGPYWERYAKVRAVLTRNSNKSFKLWDRA